MKNTSRCTKKSFLRLMALLMAALTAFSGCGRAAPGEGEAEIAVPVSTPEPQPITGGEVSASKKLAYSGDTITITVVPDAGSTV